MSSGQPNGSRRRMMPSFTSNGVPPGTREINAAPMLEHAKPGIDPDGKLTVSRAIAMAGIMMHSAIPLLVSWGVTISLIFGGCCSNVFALEAIVKEEPESGLLITFTQFVVISIFAWPHHFSASQPPFFLKLRAVPLMRWLPNIVLFFSVNMLNNFAFGYNISVPVHIILRSGGSVTTMLVGWIWGKRYTRTQFFSIAMLTIGVIVAAMSDVQSKGKTNSSSDTSTASFMTGLGILFLAQILSAIMGLYTQATYAEYGPHWHENLFYCHCLSLPLFLPFTASLYSQFHRLLQSPAIGLSLSPWTISSMLTREPKSCKFHLISHTVGNFNKPSDAFSTIRVPTHILTLMLNSLTQYACIRGVNLLGARTSALGVTVVLNVRKLVSLFASIWLFGNELPLGVMLGAMVVFAGGGIYAWDGGRTTHKVTYKAG